MRTVQCVQRGYQSMINDYINLVCFLSLISTDKMTTIQNKTKRSFSCSCRIPQFVIRNSTMDGFAPTLGKPRNFGFGTKCTYAKESSESEPRTQNSTATPKNHHVLSLLIDQSLVGWTDVALLRSFIHESEVTIHKYNWNGCSNLQEPASHKQSMTHTIFLAYHNVCIK